MSRASGFSFSMLWGLGVDKGSRSMAFMAYGSCCRGFDQWGFCEKGLQGPGLWSWVYFVIVG